MQGVFVECGVVNGVESYRMGENVSGRTSVGQWVQTTEIAMAEMARKFAAHYDQTFLGRKVPNGYEGCSDTIDTHSPMYPKR